MATRQAYPTICKNQRYDKWPPVPNAHGGTLPTKTVARTQHGCSSPSPMPPWPTCAPTNGPGYPPHHIGPQIALAWLPTSLACYTCDAASARYRLALGNGPTATWPTAAFPISNLWAAPRIAGKASSSWGWRPRTAPPADPVGGLRRAPMWPARPRNGTLPRRQAPDGASRSAGWRPGYGH